MGHSDSGIGRRLRRRLRGLLPPRLLTAFAGLRAVLSGDYFRVQRATENNRLHTRLLAANLAEQYRHLGNRPHQPGDLRPHELSVYSQNGEDGILLHLFSQVGSGSRVIVEFGVGDGSECNAANLLLNFSWSGLLMEADERRAERAMAFYRQALGAHAGSVTVRRALVTAANVNELIAGAGIAGEIDLLSIDIDGNDYWLWRAVEIVSPRIVVIEYNASLGAGRSLTVPYDEQADFRAKHPSGFYHGASLPALVRLAGEKGYVLAGCESAGVNAFFVRADAAAGRLTPADAESAYRPHLHRTRRLPVEEQWRLISALPFVEV